MKPCTITLLLIAMLVNTLTAQSLEDSLKTHHIPEVVVTGQYAPQHPDHSVYPVRVITHQQMRSMNATNVADVLYRELNIDISQRSVFGASPEIQGVSKENVKILIDGVPVIGRLNGIIDLNQLPLHNIERIEIIEGPTSVFYGTDAIGGTVNLITRKSGRKDYEARIHSSYESSGWIMLDGEGYMKFGNNHVLLGGGRNYFKGLALQDTLRHKEWESRDQYFASARYSRDIGSLQISGDGRFAQELLTDLGNFDDNNTAEDVEYLTRRWNVSTGINGEVGKTGYLDVKANYSAYLRRNNTWLKDFNTGTSELSASIEDHDTTRFNLVYLKGQYQHTMPDFPLKVGGGVDFEIESTEGRRIKDKQQSVGDYAFFASISYSPVKSLTIQPSLRYAVNTAYQAPLTPAVHLLWNHRNEHIIRASYARGFRAPSLKELYLDFYMTLGPNTYHIYGNEDLKAETSNSYNLSYTFKKQLNEKQELILNSAAYFNDIDNLIALSDLVNFERYYINVYQYKSIGGVFDITYKPLPELALQAGVNPVGRYNRLSEEHQVEKYITTVDFKASAKYCITRIDLAFSLLYKFYGRRDGYELTRSGELVATTIDPANLLDFTVSKQFFNDFIYLNGGVKNLFDITNVNALKKETGEAHASEMFLPGRTWFIGLTLHFAKNRGEPVKFN